jgi:hypothetical protein
MTYAENVKRARAQIDAILLERGRGMGAAIDKFAEEIKREIENVITEVARQGCIDERGTLAALFDSKMHNELCKANSNEQVEALLKPIRTRVAELDSILAGTPRNEV